MTFIVPTSTTLVAYTESVELDGVPYTLAFRWNERAQAWYLDISDSIGTKLASGLRCGVGEFLLRQRRYSLPPVFGDLAPFDTTPKSVDPGLEDFGNRVILLYFTDVELHG